MASCSGGVNSLDILVWNNKGVPRFFAVKWSFGLCSDREKVEFKKWTLTFERDVYCSICDQWCWQNIINLLRCIKLWKAYENLRPVNRKTFSKYWRAFCFFWPKVFKKHSLSLLRYESLFLSNMEYEVWKNPSFHTDFENVNLIWSQKKRFFVQHFLAHSLSCKVKCTYQRRIFWHPIRPLQRT